MWGVGVGLINGLVFGIEHESFILDKELPQDDFQLSWKITISLAVIQIYIINFVKLEDA